MVVLYKVVKFATHYPDQINRELAVSEALILLLALSQTDNSAKKGIRWSSDPSRDGGPINQIKWQKAAEGMAWIG